MLIEAKGSAFADMKGIFSSNCIEYIKALVWSENTYYQVQHLIVWVNQKTILLSENATSRFTVSHDSLILVLKCWQFSEDLGGVYND